MPHVSSSGGDDLASTDEVKVYNDEGEQEEQRTSEDISEVKTRLVTESEQGKAIAEHTFNGKAEEKSGSSSQLPSEHELNPFHPYIYPHNGASVAKLGLGTGLEQFNPPPAHIGIPASIPLLSLDKSDNRPGSVSPAFAWLHRPSLLSLTGASGQYPSFYPDLNSVQSWPGSPYPVASVGMRSPYSGLLAAARGYSPLMNSPLSPGMSQPTLVSQATKHDIHPNMLQENRFLTHPYGNSNNGHEDQPKEKKKPHIKKPLNAFMLFMKDMRAKVVAECTLKESAAINQILGRKWHALDRAEQAKYYEMAKKERELHLKLYPGWSARDNYAMHSKRKKRRRETSIENKECTNPKKCRARFGLDQQNQWCKPCRSIPRMPSQSQLHPEHLTSLSSSSDIPLKSESDDSLTAAGGSGINVAHSQLEQSAPITSQSSQLTAALDAVGGEDTVSSAPGDPDADEQSDKDDNEDDDMDNNNSLSAKAAGSDSDDSSQAGYSSECGTTSPITQEVPSTNSSSDLKSSSQNVNTDSISSSQPTSRASDTSHIPHTAIAAL